MRFLAGFILGTWIGAVNSDWILKFYAQHSQKIFQWVQSLQSASQAN